MSKYGEPWKVLPTANPILVDKGNRPVVYTELLRAAQCVNACAGVEFHGETHGLVKELVVAVRRLERLVGPAPEIEGVPDALIDLYDILEFFEVSDD